MQSRGRYHRTAFLVLMRTTWVVVVVVIVLSLLLAGFDFAIQALIEWFLNFGR